MKHLLTTNIGKKTRDFSKKISRSGIRRAMLMAIEIARFSAAVFLF